MSLKEKQTLLIKDILKNTIRTKFEHYKPETTSMPFHTRLLGKDRLALYSFIHSLNTAFGTSIFEPVAIIIAKSKFEKADKQCIAGKVITSEAQNEIQTIINNGAVPDNLKQLLFS